MTSALASRSRASFQGLSSTLVLKRMLEEPARPPKPKPKPQASAVAFCLEDQSLEAGAWEISPGLRAGVWGV